MPMTPSAKKPWQNGYALGYLRTLRKVFTEFDCGMCHGAFSAVKENTIANWLARGELLLDQEDNPKAIAIASWHLRGRRAINGFAGPAGYPRPGALRLRRVACLDGEEDRLSNMVRGLAADAPEVWLEGWAESQTVRYLAESLGLLWVGSKVMAGSEIVGVYYRGPQRLEGPSLADQAGLCLLDLDLSRLLPRALKCLSGLDYADHYSAYNKRHSWGALALAGFNPADPNFIIKPAEMSKRWKAENQGTLSWKCGDTSLRQQLPELEPMLRAIPGGKERIRLMSLAPRGGELARHADITDRDAGTLPGKLMRIHIPLITNPDVRFQQWTLDGEIKEAHMRAGEVWYLDTRKPHTAVNGGSTPRVHLVIDAKASPDLLDLLPTEDRGCQ